MNVSSLNAGIAALALIALCGCTVGYKDQSTTYSSTTNQSGQKDPGSTSPDPVATPEPEATPTPPPGAVAKTTVQTSQPAMVAADPGRLFNITHKFEAVPMNESLRVFVHFVDSAGNIAFGDDHAAPVDTATWTGTITSARSVRVPDSIAPGNYDIYVGLFQETGWQSAPFAGRRELAAGTGVTADAIERIYKVGTLKVNGVTTYEAESDLQTSGGEATTGGWKLLSQDETASVTHAFDLNGTHRIQVVAQGQLAGGAWPVMEVYVNGTLVGAVEVNTATWRTYSFPVNVTAGSYTIDVVFTNDYYVNPEDRNLLLDKVIVREP